MRCKRKMTASRVRDQTDVLSKGECSLMVKGERGPESPSPCLRPYPSRWIYLYLCLCLCLCLCVCVCAYVVSGRMSDKGCAASGCHSCSAKVRDRGEDRQKPCSMRERANERASFCALSLQKLCFRMPTESERNNKVTKQSLYRFLRIEE